MGKYYTGCAVWAFKDWVGEFYPAGSQPRDFLRLYCDRMTAVEGNTTFYSIPSSNTIARWADTMPADFRFCPKVPRIFSHQGPLYPHLEATTQLATALTPLGHRLGPFLLQLPPSYGPTMAADLERFLSGWPHKFPLAVEVRHLSWFREPHAQRLHQMLQNLGIGRALLDTRPIYGAMATGNPDPQEGSQRRKPEVPLQPQVSADFTFIRYIAHPEAAHNDAYLDVWRQRLRTWLSQDLTVYFFAHCPQEKYSPHIARRVYHQLQAGNASLPPLKWDILASQEQASPSQLSLF